MDAAKELQDATRCMLSLQYGHLTEPLLVEMKLGFPSVMMEKDQLLRSSFINGDGVNVYLQLAPMALLPHSVFAVR
jgi:hypothetical protein